MFKWKLKQFEKIIVQSSLSVVSIKMVYKIDKLHTNEI